jgi:hypothetical protein
MTKRQLAGMRELDMRTSNKTIMAVLGVGAVLVLAGQVMAQSGSYRGRGDSRGGSDSRSSYGNRGYTGGYDRSNSHFVAPRIVDSRHSSHGSFGGGGSYGHDGYSSRPQYGHSGFSGGFSIGFGGGFVESPRFYPSPRVIAAPRVISPGWTSYGYPVYAAPTCGMPRTVYVAPRCGVDRSVYGPSWLPPHRYEYSRPHCR